LLALDWLDLHPPHAGFGARFGRALGALHRAPPPVGGGRYGWRRDNMLGGTPQLNRWSNTSDAQSGLSGWLEFLAEQRLGALRARLALSHGHSELIDSVAAIIQALPAFFADGYAPRASLIHGDLWQGNWGMLADGTPVIYDPAVSCSDAEAELAMMELFGGPPANFWNAYRESAGVHDGYARRRGLYQLYHLLNHVLLFGGGYGRQALILARGLLSEV
jgi:fructosamine-3-kinase